jgi:hypothetical protein
MPDPMSRDDVRAMAEAVVTVQVVSLGSAPGGVSGYRMVTQTVSSQVTEVRSGSGLQVGDRVDIAIPVVASSGDVVAQSDGSLGLDATLYRQGQPFVAWAKRINDLWTALDIDIERMPQ